MIDQSEFNYHLSMFSQMDRSQLEHTAVGMVLLAMEIGRRFSLSQHDFQDVLEKIMDEAMAKMKESEFDRDSMQ